MNEHMPLDGRCVLVTGGARRLGAAIARRLHAAGAAVVVHYRRSAGGGRATQRRAQFRQAGFGDDPARRPHGPRRTCLGSWTRRCSVSAASTSWSTTRRRSTRHRSAASRPRSGTTWSARTFAHRSSCRRRRRRPCAPLADSSSTWWTSTAQRPLREHPVYCAAKAGLAMLTRSLARELGPEVRVNGIAPGPMLWPERGLTRGTKGRDHRQDRAQAHGHARGRRAHGALPRCRRALRHRADHRRRWRPQPLTHLSGGRSTRSSGRSLRGGHGASVPGGPSS